MQKKNKIFLFLIICFSFILIANNSFAWSFEVPIFGPIDISQTDVPHYIEYFLKLAIGVAGVLALISLVISGIQIMISAGSAERVSDAKNRAKSVFLGLLVLLGSYIFLGTINPNLQQLKTENLKQAGGIFLKGPAGTMPVLSSVDDTATFAGKYDEITWPTTLEDGSINCDPDNEKDSYIVYFYQDKGFKKIISWGELECEDFFDLSGASSYILQKQIPGVYFYRTTNCTPVAGSNELPPLSYTSSIPQWNGDYIASMRIINGPDDKRGPFFGAILFNDPDYKSTGFQHIKFNTNVISECYQIAANSSRANSWKPGTSMAIYKWTGYSDEGLPLSAGSGITLYSYPGWSGGFYNIDSTNVGQNDLFWQRELATLPITYSPSYESQISENEKKLCDTFRAGYGCLQSIEIKGNYLVLLSMYGPPNCTEGEYCSIGNSPAQVFPISQRIISAYSPENTPYQEYSRVKGTPELEKDFITPYYSYWIEVIPLAEPLQ